MQCQLQAYSIGTKSDVSTSHSSEVQWDEWTEEQVAPFHNTALSVITGQLEL